MKHPHMWESIHTRWNDNVIVKNDILPNVVGISIKGEKNGRRGVGVRSGGVVVAAVVKTNLDDDPPKNINLGIAICLPHDMDDGMGMIQFVVEVEAVVIDDDERIDLPLIIDPHGRMKHPFVHPRKMMMVLGVGNENHPHLSIENRIPK